MLWDQVKKAANTSRAVENTAVSGYKATSDNSIAQTSEKSNTPEENNSDAVDWEGNREQRLSVSDEDDGIDLSRYSGRDRVYMEAVKNGNTDEAAWMVEDAAKRAGFSHKGFHQTGADFTSFSTRNEVAGQFDDETPTGIFIKPTDEDIGLQSVTKQMPLYFKADNMLEFANREEIREYWKKNVPGYRELDAQFKNLVTEYMKGTDYDGIHIRFSPSEDAGDSWGVDWIGKENGPEERGSTSSASRSEAPSPQGEGSGRDTRRADVGIGPYGGRRAASDRPYGGTRTAECRSHRRGPPIPRPFPHPDP